MPVCTDDKGNNGELFCFVYTTLFKKVKLRFPLTRFERELLTELDIAAAQLHPNSWASAGVSNFVRAFGTTGLGRRVPFPVRGQKSWRSPLGEPERNCWEVDPFYLPAILQGLERKIRPSAPK